MRILFHDRNPYVEMHPLFHGVAYLQELSVSVPAEVIRSATFCILWVHGAFVIQGWKKQVFKKKCLRF